MAGTFVGIANAQQFDVDGDPLVGGLLYVYTGGTLSLANVFQDIGLAVPQQNPVPLDDSGRIPLIYVADATYRLRLVKADGTTTGGGFDLLQVPSIGPSSGGGGGSVVDSTTVFNTGDVKYRFSNEVIAGWVRLNARTIGNAVSGASERANADCQALFAYAWANFPDSKCPVSGGRGASAAADWAANKTLGLIDMRGKAPFGLDGMGNVLAGRIGPTVPNGGDTADSAAAEGGVTQQLMTQGQLPNVALNFTGQQIALGAINSNNQAFLPFVGGSFYRNDQNNVNINTGTITITIPPFTPAGTISSLNGGIAQQAFFNISPFRLVSWQWKL